MNWQEELTKLLALGKWQDIKDNAVVKQKLAEVYSYEMHDSPCCDSVLESYFTNHRNKAKKKTMINKPAPNSENFEIKKAKSNLSLVLHLKSKNIDVTNNNLTDELAVELLKENPKNINNFSIYPPEVLNELNSLPTSDELLQDVMAEGSFTTEDKQQVSVREKVEAAPKAKAKAKKSK